MPYLPIEPPCIHAGRRGEDRLTKTPQNEIILPKLGSAIDVFGERRQEDFGINTTRITMTEEIELRIQSRRQRAGARDREGTPLPQNQLENQLENQPDQPAV